ncbi:hypothetical protein [Citrobacter freundii complex sp. CFNIH2]|uniref:hypothetical protein n=1 Tax=Citrobacter freundii complex sp. CFNIH2 TaxID=2066049 RepID=UPI001651D240|nr:hypothetical protein [Citrobacter freundii complex sp. CFNIH2]
MTLGQRVESLEKELASIKTEQKANEEFSELVRNLSGEMIKRAIRPGGVIYAAQKQAAGKNVSAEYNLKLTINRQ